jgi:hypothetical protein
MEVRLTPARKRILVRALKALVAGAIAFGAVNAPAIGEAVPEGAAPFIVALLLGADKARRETKA